MACNVYRPLYVVRFNSVGKNEEDKTDCSSLPGVWKYETSFGYGIRGAVKKFPELWYSTVMVGHMTTLT